MQQNFEIGSRVQHKRIKASDGIELGGQAGTIIALPPPATDSRGYLGLYRVRLDDGTICGVAPELLEPLGE